MTFSDFCSSVFLHSVLLITVVPAFWPTGDARSRRHYPHHSNGTFHRFVCANSSELTCDEHCKQQHLKFETDNQPGITTKGWTERYPSLGALYNARGVQRAAEIGVAQGHLSSFLIGNVTSIVEYFAVDPFLGGYDPRDIMSKILTSVGNPKTWSEAVQFKLSKFGCKFALFAGFSKDAVQLIDDRSLDAVFVDGEHTKSGVETDFKLWWPKLKDGGIMVFDDYNVWFPGVVQAVDSIARHLGQSVIKVNEAGNVMLLANNSQY